MSFIDEDIGSLTNSIRKALKKTVIAKGIYLSKLSDYMNEHLANLIIDNKLLICAKNDLHKYKKMYLILKTWILLESDPYILQQFTPSNKTKINSIDNRKKQVFIPGLTNVIPDFANTFSLILSIRQ